MQYEKMQAQLEFSYLKYGGFFIIASLAFMIMQKKEIISDYCIGVTFTGLGVLFAMAISMLFFSFDLDLKLAKYVATGKAMEEKYQAMLKIRYFDAFDATKVTRFRVTAASRLLPFVLVGLFTALSGAALVLKVSTGLALAVGISSLVILTIGIVFLVKTMKQSQLLASKHSQ